MTSITTGDRIGRLGALRLGCSVVVFDAGERVLLMQRTDNGLWCLPSGGMEPGESVSEAAEREVAEETGLIVRVTDLIGVYSSPHELVTYPDGNRFQIVSLCFLATVVSGDVTVSDEATAFRYVGRGDLASTSVMANHVVRIEDAFLHRGSTVIR